VKVSTTLFKIMKVLLYGSLRFKEVLLIWGCALGPLGASVLVVTCHPRW